MDQEKVTAPFFHLLYNQLQQWRNQDRTQLRNTKCHQSKIKKLQRTSKYNLLKSQNQNLKQAYKGLQSQLIQKDEEIQLLKEQYLQLEIQQEFKSFIRDDDNISEGMFKTYDQNHNIIQVNFDDCQYDQYNAPENPNNSIIIFDNLDLNQSF